MKKLILFLLLPLWAMAQTSNGQETEFDYGIKNNSTQTITTPPYLTTTGMDGTQGKIPSALVEKTDNKQNSLAVDGTGTKFPTVDAVNTAIHWTKTVDDIANNNTGKVKIGNPTSDTIGHPSDSFQAGTSIKGAGVRIENTTGESLIVNTTAYTGGSHFYDANVLAIQNKSTYLGELSEVPSAIRFLSNTDEEMGAIGYQNGGVGSAFANSMFLAASHPYYPGYPLLPPTRLALIQEGDYLGLEKKIDRLEFDSSWNTNFKDPLGTTFMRLTPLKTIAIGQTSIATGKMVDILGNLAIGAGARRDSGATLELSGLTNAMMLFSRNSTSNSARFFFNTGSTYNWNLGLATGTSDFNITDELNLQNRLKITPGTSVGALTISGTDGGVSMKALTLTTTPTTSAGTYDFLTRNTTTGLVEKVSSNTIATTASPTFTGTPTAPTAPPGTTGNQIVTFDALQAAKQDLQSVLDKGSDATIWSQNGFNKNEIYLDVNNTNQSLVIAGAMYNIPGVINARQGGFSITDGNPEWYRDINNNKTSVRYTDPIANSILLLPAKSEGTYTLATLDDLSKRYTVSSLPTPTGSDPVFAIVTDATAPTYLGTLTGGGSVVCPVFYNGTAWVAH